MIEGVLPNFFRYESVEGLVRLGQDNDGGYLVSENDVRASTFLIGLGVNDDWSFERDFTEMNDVPVVAYDGSVGALHFLFKAIRELRRIDKPKKKIAREWRRYFSFRRFFRGSHRHVEKFVGRDSGPKMVSLKEVFAGAPQSGVFLKIDIEGGEYEILDEIVNQKERLTALAIEFHDCPDHLEDIRAFMDAFGMPIVHIHANNYSPLSPSRMPYVIEVTFSRSPGRSLGTDGGLHALDMPNNPVGEEIRLSYEG